MMRHFSCILFISLCVSLMSGQEHPQPTDHRTRDRTYHVVHYKLNIDVDVKAKTCSGEAEIKLLPLRPQFDEIRLDAAEMKISRVKLDHKELIYHQDGETLFVMLDRPYSLRDTLSVSIVYSVRSPKKGLYFVVPDSGYPNKTFQAWSQGEAEDNHFWFPCYDFPNDFSTSEMIVTVDDHFTAISNGKLIDVKRDEKRHKATYHWLENKPHVSYLISLIVGDFVEVKDSWGTIPISNYVPRHQQADAMRSFSKTPKMIEFFSTKIGYPYPWEKFAQTVVQDFIYGGEENVSAVTLTDATIHDARAHLDYSSDGLVAHELAHMWWGDLLTCRNWSHAWLNEGFATYFEIAFSEYDRGRDAAAKEILDNQITLRNMDTGDRRRPTVCNRFVNPIDVFDNHIYGKGAVILNMLRFVLGDELFWKSINHYVQKFAYHNVETNDFKVAIEEATGYNLQWFFDEWLYKAGYPEFDIASRWDQASRTVQLTVKQLQKIDSLTGIFTTPVEIETWINGSSETYRITISQAAETFSFPSYQQPQLVIFDKGSQILKKVTFSKPLDQWVFQLEHARDAVDRIIAIDELQWAVDSLLVTDAITKAALEDPFWEVRRSAVWALGDVKKRNVSEKLLIAYGDRDARVRSASVASLGAYKDARIIETLRYAFEKDSSYAVAAAALRALVKADSVNRTTYCNAGLQRDSRNEVIRSAALQLLAGIGDDEALKTLFAYTRYGIDRNLRIQCVNSMATTWKSREDVVSYLITMLKDPSFHVRRAVIGALGTAGNPRAIEPLQIAVKSEPDGRLSKDAQEAIAKIQQAQHEESH